MPLPHFKILLVLVAVYTATTLFAQEEEQERPVCAGSSVKKAVNKYEEALPLVKRKNYVQAVPLLKEAIALDPDYVDPMFLIGEINYKRKSDQNLNVMVKMLEEVLRLCPAYSVYTYYYLGDYAYQNGDDKKALQYMQLFIKDVDKVTSDEDYKYAQTVIADLKFLVQGKEHPVPFSPKPVTGIDTKQDEYLAIISADNEVALFTRRIELPPSRMSVSVAADKVFREKFMRSIRDANGNFDEGEPMEDPFNRFENEGGPTLTIDNNTLYYTVCKEKFVNNGNYYNCDIFESQFVKDSWSEIKALPANINLPNTWESQPSISSDGKTLYFVSNRPGGLGGYDIWKSTKNEKGEWNPTPVNLGAPINTIGDERSPFIHTDNQTLYFSSSDRFEEVGGLSIPRKGHKGYGGYDLFKTQLNDDGTFGAPINLGYPINTDGDEISFFVSTDGKTGYFGSNSIGESTDWNLFSFELYAGARPNRVLFLKGDVKDENNDEPVKASVELKNVKTKEVFTIPVDSNTGKYVAALTFKDDYVMSVKKEGYASDFEYFSTKDSTLDKPAKVDVEIKKLDIGESYKINDINFTANSAVLLEESKYVLDEFARFLKDHKHLVVVIQGHTDNLWDDTYNLKLSVDRAKAVHDYLIAQGISAQRLTFEGYGESKPIASNATEEGRAKNRRTEFHIINN